MRTIAYDVIGVNVFLPTLMRILPKKEEKPVPPILLFEFFITTLNFTNILITWSNHLFLEITGFQLLYVGLPKLATKCQHSPAHIGQ